MINRCSSSSSSSSRSCDRVDEKSQELVAKRKTLCNRDFNETPRVIGDRSMWKKLCVSRC